MLVATSDRSFGPSRLRSTAVLERRCRVHLISRDQLVFDTKYCARFTATGRGDPLATIYLVLRGHVQVASGDVQGPRRGYALAETEFERIDCSGPTLRTWGAPAITLDLTVRAEDVLAPIGLAHGPFPLSDRTWAALDHFHEACASTTSIAAPLRAFLSELEADGVIRSTIAQSMQDEEPEPLTRLWNGLRPLYESQEMLASIFDVKAITGMSLRQLARDIKLLTKTFGLPGEGFRDTTKVIRLRTAVVLMSAPGATATEVARVVGYNSLEAMGRAFRDAKLPAPSTILAQVSFDAMPVLAT